MPVFQLSDRLLFPPPHMATEEGLLAVGGDLRPERVLLAYQHGIFPWYGDGDPILWWSPDPRLVMPLDGMHISRRLRRTLRQDEFEITYDTDFESVIEACATAPRPRQRGTWITRAMIRAYTELYKLGFAHSVECRLDGDLVGGLYGISLGGCFFGESMFSHETDASKVALVHLVERLREWEFTLLDCQVTNPHLIRLGAREIPRSLFLRQLKDGLHRETLQGAWTRQ